MFMRSTTHLTHLRNVYVSLAFGHALEGNHVMNLHQSTERHTVCLREELQSLLCT